MRLPTSSSKWQAPITCDISQGTTRTYAWGHRGRPPSGQHHTAHPIKGGARGRRCTSILGGGCRTCHWHSWIRQGSSWGSFIGPVELGWAHSKYGRLSSRIQVVTHTTHEDNEVARDLDLSIFCAFDKTDGGRGLVGVGACASTLESEDGPAEGLTLIFPKYRGAGVGGGDAARGPGRGLGGVSTPSDISSLLEVGRGNAVAKAVVSLHEDMRSLASYEAIESGRIGFEMVRFFAMLLG